MQFHYVKTNPINKYHAKIFAYYDTKWVSGENTNSSMLIEWWYRVRRLDWRKGQCAGEGSEEENGRQCFRRGMRASTTKTTHQVTTHAPHLSIPLPSLGSPHLKPLHLILSATPSAGNKTLWYLRVTDRSPERWLRIPGPPKQNHTLPNRLESSIQTGICCAYVRYCENVEVLLKSIYFCCLCFLCTSLSEFLFQGIVKLKKKKGIAH